MAVWRFLLDENIDPAVAPALRAAGIHAESVRDAVGLGADDAGLRAYACDHNRVTVTSDVRDFASPSPTDPGVVLLYDDTTPANEVTTGLQTMVTAYPDRDAFGGREVLDDWI